MNVQWFSKSLQGVVTLYETNITLNTVAKNYFRDAYKTLIGYSKEENILLIKALDKEEAMLSKYNPDDLRSISIKSSYGRINGKDIIQNIRKFYPLDFARKSLYKFPCEWDPAKKFLKVYMEREIQ
ncbi:MAG TPA: hypothetical protein GX390_00290 [Acholeplasmataceae bacterium]|jgi:hypothetical protein|nr:hypothetical protein [Acholeplasmataceae bacterium]